MFPDRIDHIINRSDLDGHNKDICRVVVENDRGERGIAFLAVQMVRGRPKFTLTTKKYHGQETITGAVADWLI
jgi:hypothetical protein